MPWIIFAFLILFSPPISIFLPLYFCILKLHVILLEFPPLQQIGELETEEPLTKSKLETSEGWKQCQCSIYIRF